MDWRRDSRYFVDRFQNEVKKLGRVEFNCFDVFVQLLSNFLVLERLLVGHFVREATGLARVRLELVDPGLVELDGVQAELKRLVVEELFDRRVEQISENILSAVLSRRNKTR